MDYLIVIDMQKDFVNGALGTKEAVAIVPRVTEKVKTFEGKILYTRDTHGEDYLKTAEGKKLPVVHCIKKTAGWELVPELKDFCKDSIVFDKPTFGSIALGQYLKEENEKEKIDSITLIGLCTDICVISNAFLLKAFLPETPIFVDASCCAGVTPESHSRALESMKTGQIEIINE